MTGYFASLQHRKTETFFDMSKFKLFITLVAERFFSILELLGLSKKKEMQALQAHSNTEQLCGVTTML